MKLFLMALLLLPWSVFAGESHGGDVFEIGGAKKVFDYLEHESEFTPTELPVYAAVIAPQVAILKQKVPRVGRYLEKVFTRGIQPRWYFVKFKLKEIDDEGPTNLLMVSYNKSQIAVNSGRVVQLQGEDFEGLESKHKGYLLMHEATISAVGVDLVRNGSQIRSLAALFMHRSLGSFSAKEIGDEIRAIVAEPKSRLQQLAEMDTGGENVTLHQHALEDASTLADGKTPSSCLESSDHCVFLDTNNKVYWSENFGADLGVKTWTEASQYCTGLKNWAGFSDWRLPAASELKAQVFNRTSHVIFDNYPEWGVIVGPLWSGSPVMDEKDRVWTVDLQTGKTVNYDKQDATLNFRCVRSDLDRTWTNLSVTSDFKFYSNCTAGTDHCAFKQNSTGLVWSSALPGHIQATYQEASAACTGLGTWGALRGWRLPTLGEWRSALKSGFLAYTRRFPAEPVGDFSTEFWAATKLGDVGVSDNAGSYSYQKYWRTYLNPVTQAEQTAYEIITLNFGKYHNPQKRAAFACVHQEVAK